MCVCVADGLFCGRRVDTHGAEVISQKEALPSAGGRLARADRREGVVAGGVLRQSFRKLKLKAIPASLPDEIVVDVTPLKIGNKLYVGDIKTNGFSFMHPDNAVVVAVKMSRNAMKGGAAAQDDDDEEVVEAPAEGAAPVEGAAPAAEETTAE